MKEVEKRLKRLERDIKSKDLRFWIIHMDRFVSVYQSNKKILFDTFDDERSAAEFVEKFIRSKEPAQIGGGYSEVNNVFQLYVVQNEGEEIVFPLETTLHVEDIQRIHEGASLVYNNLLRYVNRQQPERLNMLAEIRDLNMEFVLMNEQFLKAIFYQWIICGRDRTKFRLTFKEI